MIWDNIKGHENVKNLLLQQIKAGRVGHAYLFVGTKGIRKDLVAKAFAADIMNDNQHKLISDNKHPDFKVWETNKKTIGVATVRDMQKGLYLFPTQATRKVILIKQGDKLTVQAQNALLKILEDPPERTTFIILASRLAHMLPTLISRCQVIKFSPVKYDKITDNLDYPNLSQDIKLFLFNLSGGSIDESNSMLTQLDLNLLVKSIRELVYLIRRGKEHELCQKGSELLKTFDLDIVLNSLETIWKLALRDSPNLETILKNELDYFNEKDTRAIATGCKEILNAKIDKDKYVNQQLILDTLLIALLEGDYAKGNRC